MIVYIVEFVTRAHSSGYENRTKKTFKTLENASKYMIDMFQEYAIEDIEDDLFVSEDLKVKAPVPTMELAKELFNPDSLKKFIENQEKYDNIIYGPYSEFCCLVPFEMSIEADELE